MEWLAWLQSTPVATWVRESGSIWAYPTILTFHTIGLSILVGANLVLSLRLLGYAADIPLAPLAVLFRFMWAGFALNAVSGIALFISDATTRAAQPVFILKLLLVTLGMVNMSRLRRHLSRETRMVSVRGKVFAILSIAIWAGAITTGRLMAYL